MIDWPLTWTIVTAIVTFVMAIAIAVTAGVACTTLIGTKRERQEENSIRLSKLWYDGKYSENFVKLSNNYEKLFPKEGKVKLDYKKEEDLMFSLEIVNNFIYRLNYYLENKKITMKNLSIDFSEIFSLNNKYISQGIYAILKKYEDRYKRYKSNYPIYNIYKLKKISGEKIPKFDEDIVRLMNIDNFFLKIAKYQENEYLINLIQKNASKLLPL